VSEQPELTDEQFIVADLEARIKIMRKVLRLPAPAKGGTLDIKIIGEGLDSIAQEKALAFTTLYDIDQKYSEVRGKTQEFRKTVNALISRLEVALFRFSKFLKQGE
jgi:hypothetical protein